MWHIKRVNFKCNYHSRSNYSMMCISWFFCIVLLVKHSGELYSPRYKKFIVSCIIHMKYIKYFNGNTGTHGMWERKRRNNIVIALILLSFSYTRCATNKNISSTQTHAWLSHRMIWTQHTYSIWVYDGIHRFYYFCPEQINVECRILCFQYSMNANVNI